MNESRSSTSSRRSRKIHGYGIQDELDEGEDSISFTTANKEKKDKKTYSKKYLP